MDRICAKTVSRKWQEVPRNEPANVSGNNIIFTESTKQITSIILVVFDCLYLNKIYAELIILDTKLDTKKIITRLAVAFTITRTTTYRKCYNDGGM
jgi:uncharacterized membrane protein YheB (UPF0754 family)